MLRLCLQKNEYFKFITENQGISKMELTKLLSHDPVFSAWASTALKERCSGARRRWGTLHSPYHQRSGGRSEGLLRAPRQLPQDPAAPTQGEGGGHSWRTGASSSCLGISTGTQDPVSPPVRSPCTT